MYTKISNKKYATLLTSLVIVISVSICGIISGSVMYGMCSYNHVNIYDYSEYYAITCKTIHIGNVTYFTNDNINLIKTPSAYGTIFGNNYECIMSKKTNFMMLNIEDKGCLSTNIFDCNIIRIMQINCINYMTLTGLIILCFSAIILLLGSVFCCCLCYKKEKF